MDLYSLILAISLAAGGTALLMATAVRIRREERLRRAALAIGASGAILSVVSMTIHIISGHRPGSAQAMSASGFIGEHPALLVAMALGTAAAGLALRPRIP